MGKHIRERNIRKYYRNAMKKSITNILEISGKYRFWLRVNLALCLIFHPKKWTLPRAVCKWIFCLLVGPGWIVLIVYYISWHIILFIYRFFKWIWNKIRGVENAANAKTTQKA